MSESFLPVEQRSPVRTVTQSWSHHRLRTTFIVGLLIALGLALRMHGLGDRPFWVDEAATLGITELDWHSFRDHAMHVDVNPPGYYLFMMVWRNITPTSEFWLRLPSVLVAVAALPLFWLFCRRAFGPRAAFLALLLLAFSAVHVRFAQEARNYIFLFTLFICALLMVQAAIPPAAGTADGIATDDTRRGALSRWIAAGLLALISACMFYLHATGLFAAASAFVYGGVTLLARRDLRPLHWLPLLVAGPAALLLAAQWIPTALGLVADKSSALSWQQPLTAEHVWYVVRSVLLAPYLTKIAVPAMVLQLACLGWAVAQRRHDPQFLGCLGALVFALLTFTAISLIEPIFFERTLLFTLALWTALLAAGLGSIGRPALLVAAAFALLLPQARALQNHYRANHFEEHWDALARHLAAAPPAWRGEPFLAIGVFEGVSLRYYARQAGAEPPIAVLTLGTERTYVPMARAMLRPRAAWASVPDGSNLCATFIGADALWIVSRDAEGRHRREPVEAELRRLGASRSEGWMFGKLLLERWRPLKDTHCAEAAMSAPSGNGRAP